MSENKNIAGKMALSVLLSLCALHCLNDLLQSVITAIYPMVKETLHLSFAEIGLITLVYQMSASIFQPLMGFYFDKRPSPWALPSGMVSTLCGLLMLAFADSFTALLFAVFMVGIGSSVLHPEASRVTSIASGGRRGLAQGVFQVGGNFGGSLGPLLVAVIVAPYSMRNVAWFSVFAILAFLVTIPIFKWYSHYIADMKKLHRSFTPCISNPLSPKRTAFTIAILLVLIFSKYIYMSNLTSYYTFYLIHKFGVSVQDSQIFLFLFLASTAVGTLVGGQIGDRIGRKYLIWISILGAAPFTLAMPFSGLTGTVILSLCAGFVLSSAFPAILIYSQELLPSKLGLVSGVFFGLMFGISGIISATLGMLADSYGLETIFNWCAFAPLIGIVTALLPDIEHKR